MNRIALAALTTLAFGCTSSGSGSAGGWGGGTELTGGHAATDVSTTTQGLAAGGSTSSPAPTGGVASPATVCTPGVTQACLGAGRCEGAQACTGDGLAWRPCDCGSGTGGASAMGGSVGLGTASATGGSVATGGLHSFVLPTSGGNAPAGGAVATGGLSSLQTTQQTLTAPCATGTLNCQCYSSGICTSGLTCNASKICVSNTTSGGAPSTGGRSGVNNSTSIGGVPVTGGTHSTGGTLSTGGTSTVNACAALTPPTSTGTLTISSAYVTTGTLSGYAATYIGDLSNAGTCITPRCTSSSCSPGFGSSALCAAGVVAADENYNSIAGISLNLNQPQAQTPVGSITAPTSVTVDVVMGAGSEKALRLQLTTDTGDRYCVDAGKWVSGQAIPITAFNSYCWDPTHMDGRSLLAGSKLTSIDLVVFSDSVQDHPFSVCLTGLDFE